MQKIKVIGFDADDTLWVNEPHYQNTERSFCKLLKGFLTEKEVSKELLNIEIQNIEKYGYGVKSFMLSMIETALKISDDKLDAIIVSEIIVLGKRLIDQPIELIDDIENVIKKLSEKFKIIVATKGDLLDQQRKLKKSGISQYFSHVEIMSEKKEKNYLELLSKLQIEPEEFLMVGNSVKSDIIPVLSIGAKAIHVPFHTTWEHEKETINTKEITSLSNINQLLAILL